MFSIVKKIWTLPKKYKGARKLSVETCLVSPSEPPNPLAQQLPPGAGRGAILKEHVHRIQTDQTNPIQRQRRHGRNFYATGPKVCGWDNCIREYAYAKSRVSNFVDISRRVTPITIGLNTLRHRYV
jgi:hypothetical protein